MKEIGARASTNKKRHPIVTYFMLLPEAHTIKLRESLATLLKHSVHHQQNTYKDQHCEQKTEIGRKSLLKSIIDNDPFKDGQLSSHVRNTFWNSELRMQSYYRYQVKLVLCLTLHLLVQTMLLYLLQK